jgi:hypothetical protein
MLNYASYDEDFRQLGLNEEEQKVVLDYFHQLGEILFNNNNIEKLIQDELEEKTKEESRKAS